LANNQHFTNGFVELSKL